ncbi:MAG: type II toxin-antitoxin system RelE/ParE family toxin [Dysgonamonadaceae bacterium]|jgi:mRNA-degrading endonuclease RelE of RelBE toxin-antitoxin system|nr:type II toxin-antitoxin system RelE/ParE family toxin [Dysgonamonadaceae bacterium]
MTYTVKSIPQFEREAKRLVKKYPSLKNELKEIVGVLKKDPEKGTSLGNNVFKIRLAIASKGKGKRGGARIITYYKTGEGSVYLLSIYDKGKKDTVSDNEIQKLLDNFL